MRGAAIPLLLLLLGSCAPHRATTHPGIVLVILDTVRADHLGCYGYARPTTPNLDRLAAEGERYEEAYAQAPWTLPAVASILTGQPPHVHGAGLGARGLHPVRAGVPTLSETLKAAGFRTAAFFNVVFCSSESGLARGFDHFDYWKSDATNVGTRDARATTDAALLWAREVGEAPFFLVVHYFDAHLTYDPPPPFDSLFEPAESGRIGTGFGTARQVREIATGRLLLTDREKESLIARYDGEIRYLDEQFGRLRDGLEEAGLLDRSLVVVVADHGEEFWDHDGFEHGHSHHRELIRVPLLVRRPGPARPVTLRERVRQIDIAPTILEFVGLPYADTLPGFPLGGTSASFAVAEGSLWAGDLVSIRSDAGTLLVDRTSGLRTAYAAGDRFERTPLAASAADDLATRLVEALPSSRTGEPGAWEPSAEQLEKLRSLGYVR